MRRPSRRAAAAQAGSEVGEQTCSELGEAVGKTPRPVTPGECEDCAAIGEQVWSHLRVCLECGHVGCCDSSPHQHATMHFRATGHPVMQSHEPGESWRWCYVHNAMG